MKLKRLAAYIVDMIIVLGITELIFSLPMFKNEYEENARVSEELVETILKSGSSDPDTDKLTELGYKSAYTARYRSIIEIGTIIIYFGAIQYGLKGQTAGKKLLKIQIVPEKGKTLEPGLFMLRCVILYGIIFSVTSTFTLIMYSQKTYLSINSVLNYLSILVSLAIIGTSIFRDDERGLHDLICNTKVISTKKEK